MRTTDNQPEGFKQRILLTLMGHSPAIITETLYALSQQTPIRANLSPYPLD